MSNGPVLESSSPVIGRRPWTLRLRLVLALVALSTVGLAVFGFGTYKAFADSEYRRLDSQLEQVIPDVARQLRAQAGLDSPSVDAPPKGGLPPDRPDPGRVLAPGLYAELWSKDGVLLANIQSQATSGAPELPAGLDLTSPHLLTVGTTEAGGGDWRVVVAPDGGPDQETVVVAVPTSGVLASLRGLVVIELVAAALLLVLLGVGAWMILRRGLRPLENMADTARAISGGDLSHRVDPTDDRGEVGVLGSAINIMLDDIEEAFRERQESEEKLRRFLADASHELRTPLTSIQGFAELYRLGAENDHVNRDVVIRRIEQESARMARLVEDLLLLARLDRTRTPEFEAVDLAVLCADACSDAVAAAPDRPVRLDAPIPIVVRGDRDHLRQAIGNLVANCLRHTPAGTPVDVGAHVVGGRGVVTIRDHGSGLGKEAASRVFERFWQADEARAGEGVGLGLAIVAAIAAEHGGEVAARNHPDGGAEFTLAIPVS